MAAVVTPVFTPANFYKLCNELAAREIFFAAIISRHGYPPLWSRPQGFETLVHIILEQQVSLASALAAYHKLKLQLDIIAPEAFLSLSDEVLRACYFSRQKIIYTRHLAQSMVDGSLLLEKLEQLDDDTVLQQLTQVKGIGKWTTDVYLMMVLHRTDCFPIGDIALVNSMKFELQLPVDTSKETLLMRAESWRPYRTIAAYLLWHAYLSRRRK